MSNEGKVKKGVLSSSEYPPGVRQGKVRKSTQKRKFKVSPEWIRT